ncbi:hypothetical protein NPIL_399971 [Nephila pilipes]|uniref:Uncharacterized protein n=1 Tax=Nephila pilipes TaxID=299642 RepID=A0A8X6U2F3_NEPPI|nr:hypothetical protein NPIL_399971 [Nephila pilipes]
MQAKLLENQRAEAPRQEECGTKPMLRKEEEKKEEEILKLPRSLESLSSEIRESKDNPREGLMIPVVMNRNAT